MAMSHEQAYEHAEMSYGGQRFDSTRGADSKRQRTAVGRRRAKNPQSFNGIHRRRRKKLNW
jgi:hypothetical protein